MRLSSAPARRSSLTRRMLLGVRTLAAVAVAGVLALTPARGEAQAVRGTFRYDSLGTLRGLNGTGVGPLHGTLLALPDRPSLYVPLSIVCVDMLNGEVAGMSYDAFLTRLDGSSPIEETTRQGARFDDALTRYRKAAWLSQQFATNPADAGGLQAAIWSLFSPLNHPYMPSVVEEAQQAYWLGEADLFVASAAYGTYDWSRFVLITEVGAVGQQYGGTQEFLTYVPPTTTAPEPATVTLLGAGVVAVGVIARRRRRA